MNLDLRSSRHYDCSPTNVEKPNNNYERSATSFTASLNSSVTSFNDSQLLDANTPAAPTMESLLADHPWQDSNLNTRGRLAKGSAQAPPGVNPIDHLNSSISESLNFLHSSSGALSISEDDEEPSSESDEFSLLPMTRLNNNNLNDSLASLNIDDLVLNSGSDHSNAENHDAGASSNEQNNSSARHNGSIRRSARRFQNYNSSSKRCHDSSIDLLLEEEDGNEEIIRLLQRQAEVLKEQLFQEQETNVTSLHHMSMQQLPKLISPYERSSSNLMCFHASLPALMDTTSAADTADLRKKLHSSVRSLKASFKERRYQAQQELHQSLQHLETNLAATEREETHLERQLQLEKTQLEQRTRQQADRIAQLEEKIDGATASTTE